MTEAEPFPPERPSYRPLIALQSRMLLAANDLTNKINVIDPNNKEIPAFQAAELGTLESHDYSLFNQASTNERRRTAGVKREELDVKVTEWAKSCVELFKTDPRAEKLKRYFYKDPKELNVDNMKNFYNKYFTGENKQSDLKLFVKDTINRYTSNGKVDVEALQKDLDGIEWFAHVFGGNSAEIVLQLIDAEVKLATNPEEFVRQANQNRNNLTTDDRRLLTFLWENRPTIQPTPEPQAPEPTEKPTEPAQPDYEDLIKEVIKDHPEIESTYEEVMSTPVKQEYNLYNNNARRFQQWIDLIRQDIREKGQKKADEWSYTRTITSPQDQPSPEIEMSTEPSNNGWFRNGAEFAKIATTYGLPMALFIPGNHAMALLKVLEHEMKDGKIRLKLLVYNPTSGDQLAHIEKDTVDTQIKIFDTDEDELLKQIDILVPAAKENWYDNLNELGIYPSEQGFELIKKGVFDFTLKSDALLMADERLIKAKSGAYQLKDASNCIPYSFLAALVRAACKYDKNDPNMPKEFKYFFEQGLNNFANDWKLPVTQSDGSITSEPFHIMTRDELIPKPAQKDEVPTGTHAG